MAPIERAKNRSFGWAFWITTALILGGGWWGQSIGLMAETRAALVAIGGLVPLSIHLITGYGLDSGWVASFSRSEQPKHYWGSFGASLAVAVCMGFAAYRIAT